MPRIILHVGPGKTGSKYLQSALAALREPMRQDGIDYADDWWDPKQTLNHIGLFGALQRGDVARIEDACHRLQESAYPTMILSCESFYMVKPEMWQRFKALLPGTSVEVVFYCRRWSERIVSTWQQSVKGGSSATLPEWCTRVFRAPAANPNVNYAVALRRLGSVFGEDSLRLVSYSNLRDHDVDILQHFLRVIVGWQRDFVVPSDRVITNVSPGPVETEMIRILNTVSFHATGRRAARVRVRFLQFRELDRFAALAEQMRAELDQVVLDDSSSVFAAAFAATSAFANRLVSPEYGQQIFQPRSRAVDFVRSDYLMREGAPAAVRELYRALGL